MKRWECLDVDCGEVVVGESDEELVDRVNAHVHDAHGSYELEEMILAVAEDTDEPMREAG